jgi:hypothetical protein
MTGIKSVFQLRRGTQAELDSLAADEQPLAGEPIFTDDTHRLYVGIDSNTPPVQISGGQSEWFTVYYPPPDEPGDPPVLGNEGFILGNQTGNTRGSRALDIQSIRAGATDVASGANSVAVGNSCMASGIGAIAFGSSVDATATNALTFGRSMVNDLGSSVLVGHGNAIARTVNQAGWQFGLENRSTAYTAGAAAIGSITSQTQIRQDAFAFRRDGNTLLIDVNIGGTIRTYSLGTGT